MMAVDHMGPVYSHNMVDIKKELPKSDSGSKTNTIHSGHFMVSCVHDVNKDEDEEEDTSPLFNDDSKGYDFLTANRETCTTYNFSNTNNQSAGIDASLTKLFECMTLAYSGKITSPKWKQFRGLHLSQKQRIRLNNLIWREWHLQYIYGKRPMVCQFATPLSDHIHSKPEAVVLEGKYWKRQLDAVTAEYKKWRRYFKDRMPRQQGFSFLENQTLSEWELLERVKELNFIPHSPGGHMSSTDLNLLNAADVMDMDLTNELFASLNQPFAFPNPRELSQLGCADLIQPGLIQLQPNLEEFMDIDSMQEFFNIRMPSFCSPFMTDSTCCDSSMAGLQSTDMTLENFLRVSSPVAPSGSSLAPADNLNSFPSTVLCDNSTASFLPDSPGLPQNITFQLTEDSQYPLDPRRIIFQGSPQTLTLIPGGVYSHISAGRPNLTSTAISSSELLAQLIEYQQQSLEVTLAPKNPSPRQGTKQIQPAPSFSRQQQMFQATSSPQIQPAPSFSRQQPIQPAPSFSQQQQMFQATSSPQNPLLSQSLPFRHRQPQTTVQQNHVQQNLQPSTSKHLGVSDTNNRDTASSGGVLQEMTSRPGRRRDGPFTVPTYKPVGAQRKPQVTAPVKPSTPPQQTTAVQPPSSQASYLAELLKNGTYPGALVHVKNEPQLTTVSSRPIKTTTNFYQNMSPSYNRTIGHNLPGAGGVAMTTTKQTNHPVLSNAVDSGLGGARDFDTEALSSNLDTFDAPLSRISRSPTRYSHGSESKLSPGQNNTGASPPLDKRTPSSIQPMDMGSFLEPVSPFSPAISLSPSNTIFEGSPDSPGSEESPFTKDNRRTPYLSAEQKRRCNLKTGFDLLQQLVPALSQNPKVSKATMLQKTAEYCKKLKSERVQMQKESSILKEEIDALNSAINTVQSQLPETGVPVTRQRKDQMMEMFDEYVRVRTNENSKFWIFSMLMSTLYDSYCNTVSTSSMEELCRTSSTWLDQSCSLVTLRPNVLNALRKLSTSTPIMTDPQRMKQHALQVVARKGKGQRSSNMMIK